MTEKEIIQCLNATINQMKNVFIPKFYPKLEDRTLALNEMNAAIRPLIIKLRNKSFSNDLSNVVKSKALEIWQRSYKKHQVNNARKSVKQGQLNNETREILISQCFYLDFTDDGVVANVLFVLFNLMATTLIHLTIKNLSELAMLDTKLNEKNINGQNIFEYIDAKISQQLKRNPGKHGRLSQEITFVLELIAELEKLEYKGIRHGFTQSFLDSLNFSDKLMKRKKRAASTTSEDKPTRKMTKVQADTKKATALTYAFEAHKTKQVVEYAGESDDFLDEELMACLSPRTLSRLS